MLSNNPKYEHKKGRKIPVGSYFIYISIIS